MKQIKHRPVVVTILFLLVLIISGFYGIRFIFSITKWKFLKGVLFIDPTYLAISGIFWGSIFLVLTVGIYTRKKWVPIWIKVAGTAYFVFFWIDRLLIRTNRVEFDRLIFYLFSSIILLLLVFLILNKHSVKIYFGELNEQ